MRVRLLSILLLLASTGLGEEDAGEYPALLRRVVHTDGIDFDALAEDHAALDRFVASISEAEATGIPFWINAYNALTLQQVLTTRKTGEEYSVKGVPGFWTRRTWTVAGRKLSLDAIEHTILRKEFEEPRIHFALHCASKGCPPLSAELYAKESLDRELDRRTRAFLADRERNRFDLARKRADLSMLFSWYRGDFEKKHAKEKEALALWLADYAPGEEVARSLRAGGWTFRFLDYDWGLSASRAERGIPVYWLGLYLTTAFALLLYGLHAFRMLVWRARKGEGYRALLRDARARSPVGRTEFPRVLVQVPVFNECAVVERAVRAVCALDWPPEAIEVQVLDDSTDATRGILDRLKEELSFKLLRRSHRDGFKAGALAAGLSRSDAPFVAIFDADFLPSPDFLRRALPLFDATGRIGCVQGRWEHLNRSQNWLTRAQAVATDAHFRIVQFARAAAGRFLNFSGTAGVWRREAIDSSGGWSGDTLTEDLDLSYRAQLSGWRILLDVDLPVPAELPPTVAAYKSQQRRWACGSMQCVRKHLLAVWRSPQPLHIKTEATIHLCAYAVCLPMAGFVLFLPLNLWHVGVAARLPFLLPFFLVLWASSLGPIAVSIEGQRERRGLRFREILACFLLGLGSTMNNALAVVRGLLFPIRTFVRTPKQGLTEGRARAPAPRLELLMAGLTLASVVRLARTAPAASATYALFCSLGFCLLAVHWWRKERGDPA